MNALTNFIAAIRRDNEGQDLLEYALLVALIAIVAVAAITTAGEAVVTQFEAIAAALVAPSCGRRPGRTARACVPGAAEE